MFDFDNTHIFTGYLKQLLGSFSLPTCRVYLNEYRSYYDTHHEEDPRVIKSFDVLTLNNRVRPATRINYLKDNELYYLLSDFSNKQPSIWKQGSTIYYDREKNIQKLTRRLDSPGSIYDTKTHEYLGDFLRFLRDYYDTNLMPLYNCFTNKIYNNIYLSTPILANKPVFKQTTNNNSGTWTLYAKSHMKTGMQSKQDVRESLGLLDTLFDSGKTGIVSVDSATNKWKIEQDGDTYITCLPAMQHVIFDSNDPSYKIYAMPVKLFADYTIAIDCSGTIELFCGIYNTNLNTSNRGLDLLYRTYQKVSKPKFNQPFLYNKLNVQYWQPETANELMDNSIIARCDLANYEQDLKLFIKVPTSCKSSITVLEGDYRHYNDCKYAPNNNTWEYESNKAIINFQSDENLNSPGFKPISKLQLLAFNTEKSYPFADRLVEYLCGSAITSLDGISDNIKRVQAVMNENGYYFRIPGVWENKIQKLIYDYLVNSGPIEIDENGNLVDRKIGKHGRVGYTSKSTLYDVLGYVDKDAEKFYASWTKQDNTAVVKDTIKNINIYNNWYTWDN